MTAGSRSAGIGGLTFQAERWRAGKKRQRDRGNDGNEEKKELRALPSDGRRFFVLSRFHRSGGAHRTEYRATQNTGARTRELSRFTV